jgi:hypothetical protein
VVGLDVFSSDERGPLKVRSLTINTEMRYYPAVRFDIFPAADVDSSQIAEAQLFFREQPWLPEGDETPNSDAGCAAVKVGGAVLIGVPITEASLETEQRFPRFSSEGVAGELIQTGLPSVDVTAIVREWLDRRRFAAFPRGPTNVTLGITPARPQLDDSGLVGLPLLSNRRRKLHWVRDRRWRIDGSRYRFRCLSRLVDLHIVARVKR